MTISMTINESASIGHSPTPTVQVAATTRSDGLARVDPDTLSLDEIGQWTTLFEQQDGYANPFCSPEWALTWYRHFTAPDDRVLLMSYEKGRLLGVAPLFLSAVKAGPLTLGHRFQLVGAGQGTALLELPQVLAAPGQERALLRGVVEFTTRHGGDATWGEIAITRAAGWFEPDWVLATGERHGFYRQHPSRACVMIELLGSWEATAKTLKRNVKESLRRSRNRLAKDGRPSVVHLRTHDLTVEVVDRFIGLHSSRAGAKVAVQHHNAFADPAKQAFLRELLPTLGACGGASILELELAGRIVATQLVLHAAGLTYIHSSGFDPDEWALGLPTHLQGLAIQAAADRGERWVNMSPGPNMTKLRWSTRLDVHDDFAYGVGPISLGRRYAAFAAGQSFTQVCNALRVGRKADVDKA